MPLYTVDHSFPLNTAQKTDLAERITKLHATKFTTPSMYIQVKFASQDPSHQNHFVAGKVRTQSSNRILAYVRSGSTRPQSAYEELAERIEHAWYVVLGEKFEGDEEEIKKQEKEKKESSEAEKAAKELLSVAFVPGLVGREKGYTWPEAGKEGEWVQRYREELQAKGDAGDEDISSMMEEINIRDDLKGWRA